MDNRSKTSAINGRLGGRPKALEDFIGMPDENWRLINGFDDYFVSDLGRVISTKSGKLRVLVQISNARGYKTVNLHKNSSQNIYSVHRLVLGAFKGKCPEKHEGSHLDGSRDNNALANLTWETHAENVGRKKEHGTTNAGERNGRAKFTDQDVISIRAEYKAGGIRQEALAERYGVYPQAIRMIIHRKSWSHI